MATNKRNYWKELGLKDRAQFYPYFIEQGIISPKDIADIFNSIYDAIYQQGSETSSQQDIYSQWDNYFDAVNKINREKNRVEGHPGLGTLVDYSPNIPKPSQELPRDYFWRKEREALNNPNRNKLELYGNGGDINEVREEIEQLWPSAKRFGKDLPDYQLKHDPNYKGYGNIEYFREPGIYYDQTGHMEMNPFGGFSKGIVYNDNTNTDDIKLDLLHHYWTVDPEYRKLWENYVASQGNNWGDFMYNGAGEQFPEPYPQKDREEFFRNGVDASLRDLLAADDNRASYNTKEGAEKQWLSTKAARDAFSELKEYLEREPSAKAYGGNLYGLGSWVNKGIGKLRQLIGWKKPIDNNSTSGYEWSDDQITDIAKAFETYQNKAYIGVKGDVLGGYGHKMTKDEIGKYWDSEKQEAKETIPDRVIQGWLKSDMDTAFKSVDTYYGKDIPSNIRAALAALSFQGGDKLIRGKRDDAGNIVDSWGGSPNFERAVKAYIKDNSQDNLNAIFNQMQYKDDNKSNMRGLSSRYGLYRAIVENIADPKKVQEYKDSATFNLYRSNKTK